MPNTVERGLVNKSTLTAIGDAIRAKNGSTTKYKPSEMAAAISKLKTGELMVATSDKFTLKVIQSNSQIITSELVSKTVNNSDGTISLAVTDSTTISSNTNYIPGTIHRSYNDSTHTYTVTATDAEPIEGLVKDGWSVVYQERPDDSFFYTNPNYTGDAIFDSTLRGNILVGGMTETDSNGGGSPSNNDGMTKYKNTFITSAGNNLLQSCASLTSIELPNLTTVGNYFASNCSSLTSIELPNLTTIGGLAMQNCASLTSIELPSLTTVGKWTSDIYGNNTAYFTDFGYITTNQSPNVTKSKVVIFRASEVYSGYMRSDVPTPVLYIVPSSLVGTYKSKVRSQDFVTALEKSPFADGKTVGGNHMKTEFVANRMPKGILAGGTHTYLTYDCWSDSWKYNTLASNVIRPADGGNFFHFLSKLTEEKGYTIPK